MDRSSFEAYSRVVREPLLLLDSDGLILGASDAAAKLLGLPVGKLVDARLEDLVEPATAGEIVRRAARSSSPLPYALSLRQAVGESPTLRSDAGRVSAPGDPIRILMRLRPHGESVRQFSELRRKIEDLSREIHQRRRAESLIESQLATLEHILSGHPLQETFDPLLRSLEDVAPAGMAASILLLDEDEGVLRHLSAPSLPDDYNKAIDGLPIGPEVGSCGTAAFRNEPVVASNIETDPRWAPWRDLALGHGLRACWSTPIPSRDGRVLGTFAMYFREPRKPTAEDRDLIDLVTSTAAIAIEGRLAEDRIRALLDNEREARAEAEEANRLKGEFLAIVSHELRTPLTSILGWSRLLRSDRDELILEEGLDTIETSARAQVRLVEDLLDVSRISTGRMNIERTPVDLGSVIRSAIGTVRPAAETNRIAIETRFPENVPYVLGDPRRLHQIVWNLLTNAIKFSPSGGTVEIRLTERNEMLRLTVSDEGEGIDPEFLPRLFERFSQSESAVRRTKGGLGLGLSIVRDLVDLHGGTIDVVSEPGKGSQFHIDLAIAREILDPRESDVPKQELYLGGNELAGVNAILVEDDEGTRQFLSILLQRSGAELRVAGSVKEGLEACRQLLPDVLICDLGLPGASGIDLIRILRDEFEGPKPLAIAISAYLQEAEGYEALAAGFDSFLSKPLDPEHLINEIRQNLEDRVKG